MKLTVKSKSVIIEIICLLYIFLLVYAAMNKGLDFENFKVELGQSPLLSAFAHWISWTVLIVEFAIAILLLFPRTRIMALHAGFCLMTMFTAYIFVILNYSSFVPCSCGGILEKMNWKEHLLFNIIFVALAGLALWLNHPKSYTTRKIDRVLSYPAQLLFSFILSAGAVVLLFLSSEEIMHHRNPFIRRYPHHPITLTHTLDLKYNSYYFAGSGDGKLYLGNYTVPLYLLSLDSKLRQQKIGITLDRESFSFQSMRIAVRPPFFHILDGNVPVIFSGPIATWKAKLQESKPPYFTSAVPIDSTLIAFRGFSKTDNNNILGLFNSGIESNTRLLPQLLQKQIDGIFDTDGMLHYSSEMKRMVYLYSYRNEYILADKNGILDYRGNTIDTISKAQIKVAYLKNKTERRMSVPPLIVNAHSAILGKLLFVNSKVPGRYEQQKVWKQSSIIDVYDLSKNSYLFSFPIHGIADKKIRSFHVTSTHLYALIDTQLVVYILNDILKNEIKSVTEKGF
jgi:hypothetical protein